MNKLPTISQLLEDNRDTVIRSLEPRDRALVREGIHMAFGHYGDWVLDYTEKMTAWDISFKIEKDGKTAGFYLVGKRGILDWIASEDHEVKQHEDLTKYKTRRGLEGLALFVFPAYRSAGLATLLKNALKSLSYDYVWGQAFKDLGNLQDWQKRRRLVAETDEVYVTLEDLK